MPGSEDEIYSTMFSSLKHPVRRKILRILSEKPKTFSNILEELEISSSHLTYHLESLGELLAKTEDGKYKLSTFGEASVNTMKKVEEPQVCKSKRLAMLPIRWKTMIASLLVMVVLLASFSAVQHILLDQSVQTQQRLQNDLNQLKEENQQLISWGMGTNRALEFIKDVAQVDLTRYQTTLISYTIEYRDDLGGILEETQKYALVSSESKIDIVLRFRDNHFSRYQLYIDEGTPIYTQPQPTQVIAATKSVLERYKEYSNDTYLEDMSRLMAAVDESEDSGVTFNQTKLVASNNVGNKEAMLLYTESGVDFSAKSLRTVFTNNLLTELTDGWFLLTVGSTQVNISQEQAVQIAKDYVKGFDGKAIGIELSNVTVLETPVSVQFVPHPRDQFLSLIPYWYIILQLDTAYPNEINRISIGVWADTGEVANIQILNN